MKSIPQWLERLSLDAVIVAVIWGIALSNLADRTVVFHDMLVLGLSTWLTYVADRLREVRPGKPFPDTDRHVFHHSHYREFKYLWIVVFGGTVGYAISVLPDWKLFWGWLLLIAIVGYLAALSRIRRASARLLFKRVTVPLIFTAGVMLMTDAWRHLDAIAGTIVLFSTAFSNVLLISYRENRDKQMPGWLPVVAIQSVFALLIISHAALFVHWQAGLAGLACFIGYFVLYIQIRTGKVDRVRTWVDAILACAGLLLLVL